LNPSINALATVTIVVVTLVVIASTLFSLRQDRQRKRDIAQAQHE
jgi:putrescine transport system permease protein